MTNAHKPDDPVGLSPSGQGVGVWRGDELVLRLDWAQARALRDLLDEALAQRTGAQSFADGVLAGLLELDDDEVDEVRPALEGWFDRWATEPVDDDRAEPGRE